MTNAAPKGDRAAPGGERWDDLYDFLDPTRHEKQGSDRDKEAEGRYYEITHKLICFFAGRGCRDAEDLATETVLRVAAKCRAVDASAYEGRAGYFYAVGRNVLHEWQRDALRDSMKSEAFKTERARLPAADVGPWTTKEAVHRCLDLCMTKLTDRARRVIVGYYTGKGTAKIEHHRDLADEFGKTVNALRIEVHRIRRTLRTCVAECVHPGTEGVPNRGRS